MSESDVSALKGTLYAQQKLLQKLYNELEAERESSATAASEAISYILRIQGEKAALKMDSEQYKRLSEEKIYHAEESLAITEDIIYQKEMEIAALDCQVQAYRYKLLSMGCVLDSEFCDSSLQRNEHLAPISLTYKNVIHEKESRSIREMDSVSRNVEGKKGDDSYMQQIRRLDYQVREMAGASYGGENRSPSVISPQISGGDSCDLSSNSANPCPNLHDLMRKNDVDVHDVFEVPQDDERDLEPRESTRKGEKAFQTGAVKQYDRDESEWLKKVFHNEKSLCRPSEVTPIECHMALVQPRIGVSESQLKLSRLNMGSEIVEIEGPAESSLREEELKLLNEIREKLNSLHEEIRSFKVKKPSSSSTKDETSLCALREAMLYFWL